jgi:hypothetical protein
VLRVPPLSVCMYVCVCFYVRRPVAPSPAPAAVDLGGGGVWWGWRAGGGGVRWWWRGGPCAFPFCVWCAAVVACGGGGVVAQRWWRAMVVARRWWRAAAAFGGGAVAPAAFFISKNTFTESYCRLSAHMHREGDPRLSAKGPSPAAFRRERFAESLLSVNSPP